MSTYTILLLPENDGSGFTVEVPMLPGVVTFGATRVEALEMAREAIQLYLEAARDNGWDIPVEYAAPELARVEIAEPLSLRPVG